MKKTAKIERSLCSAVSHASLAHKGAVKTLKEGPVPDVEAGLIVNIHSSSLLHFGSLFPGPSLHSFNVIFVRQMVSCF